MRDIISLEPVEELVVERNLIPVALTDETIGKAGTKPARRAEKDRRAPGRGPFAAGGERVRRRRGQAGRVL